MRPSAQNLLMLAPEHAVQKVAGRSPEVERSHGGRRVRGALGKERYEPFSSKAAALLSHR